MDAPVWIAILMLGLCAAIFLLLGRSGRSKNKCNEDSVTEAIVARRARTGVVPLPGMHARLAAPNPEEDPDDVGPNKTS